MKKLFIFLNIVFFISQIHGQYKYKIEYDLTTTAPRNLNNGFEIVQYELRAYNNTNLLDVIYLGSPVYLNPDTKTKDEVVEYANQINQFGHISIIDRIHPNPTCGSYDVYFEDYDNSCTLFRYFGSCITPTGTGKISPIFSLESQNSDMISSNLKKCETQSLKVFDCGTQMSYSVQCFVKGIKYELLPYGEYPVNFEFDYNDIPNIETATNFSLQINYIENPTEDKDKSDIITLQFINCSPELDGPIVDIQPSCSNSINTNDNGNGSFTVTFDRELDDTKQEKMNLQVWKQIDGTTNFDGYESKVVEKTDFTGRSYTWTPRNLPGGTYKLFWQTKSNNEGFDNINTVPDAYDESTPFILNDPPNLSVTGVKSNVRCGGGNDGSITVTPSGGKAPYEYSIDSGTTWQTTTLFDELIKGDYTITIRDTNDCETNSTVITIDELFPDIPAVSGLAGLVINPTLIGGNNGRISILVSGGTGNYVDYTWTKDGAVFTPSGSSTNTGLRDLYAGTYGLIVTDSNGCVSDEVTFILTDPNPIEITFTTSPDTVNCSYTIVTLNANVTGGFLNTGGNYTYLWDDGSTEASLSDVTVGVYEVTVTDQGGNSLTQSFEVTGPEPLISIPTVNPVACKNGNDGSITLVITGGTPLDLVSNPEAYTVIWSKIGTPSFSQSGMTVSNLTAGFYEYEVTDLNNCTVDNFGNPLEVTEPLTGIEVFETVASHEDNIIFGGETGVLEININNVIGTPSFAWFKDNTSYVPASGSTDTRLINLGEGEYTVQVTNGDGCIGELPQPIRITAPALLEIDDSTKTNVNCKGDSDGKIVINAIGGIEPYTYIWKKTGTPSFIAVNDATVEDLAPGQYTVTVTDDSGSSAEVTSTVFEITEPDLLEIVLEGTTEVICPGDTTGAIDISIIGGTPPYTVIWDMGATTQDIENLTVGAYNIMVEDALGCISDRTIVVINQDDQFRIDQEVLTNVSAYEGSDGRIELQIAGGVTPYTFSWVRASDNSFIGNTAAIEDLTADIYTVIISDGAACMIENTYEITQPDIVDASITALICAGECSAAISIEVNRGNGDFTYQWDTGETTETISGLCAGLYTVNIEGFRGKTLTRTYEIIDPDPVPIDLGEERYICLGQTTSLSARIDDANATYLWSSDTGYSNNQAEIVVSEPGIYTATVTDSKGCMGSDSIRVYEVATEITTAFLFTSQVYTDEQFVMIDITNPKPDTIEWIVPEEAQISAKDQDLMELSFATPGEYEITMISTLGNCQDSYTQKVVVLEGTVFEGQDPDTSTTDQLVSIKEFTAYPNPSDGNFTVTVELKEAKDISISIFGLSDNTILAQVQKSGQNTYEIPFTMQVVSGVYAIVLETPYGKAIRKLILK
ncbi:hypothetical protein GCM10022393_21820 [Aquimarina addita]|uniref:Secretion system C-terminal sorting domain-containing protein n=1 Tax=Aquimarina addita TaxID=870485 RepID=A0ABP6UMP2_9FLAO